MSCWPEDVGILAIEVVFPSYYVDQTELEEFDGVSSGKYTIGLGQQKMGFCTDREDINSLCLTVVQKLLENHDIKPSQIGRLEVGTETILDKSKSVKTQLMQLFEPYGVTDLEGIDTTNACYGGTAALLNALNWVESSAWNGRYALVVAGDIAIYAKGPARPTGGAGAIAMLIGPNAPLVFDRGVRATYMSHVYDFYKPDLTSEYPLVDGKLTIECYLSALDNCYKLFKKNLAIKLNHNTSAEDFDIFLFHTPYCKLVQKSLARLALNDFLDLSKEERAEKFPGLDSFNKITLKGSYYDKDVEKAFLNVTKTAFTQKTEPSLYIAKNIGNMYTASLYSSLVSLLVNKDVHRLIDKKIVLFSYGSGLAATMFSLNIPKKHENSLRKLVSKLSHTKSLLEQRQKIPPHKFEAFLQLRADVCHMAPYTPVGSLDNFFQGTYYLTRVDEKHRRFYERIPLVKGDAA